MKRNGNTPFPQPFLGICLLLSLMLLAPTRLETMIDLPLGLTTSTAHAQGFCDGVTDVPLVECQALEALYQNTGGATWVNHSGWLQDTTLCGWYGVTCAGGHVTELQLAGNNLQGAIPNGLADLSQLQILYLYENHLIGVIPAELGTISTLTRLDLSQNQLSGSIPAALGGLTNVEWFNLSTNQLSGSMPAELGNLSSVQVLRLSNNGLAGLIPPTLGNLANLQWLDLGHNQLIGTIPTELGNLTNIRDLFLYENQLSGSIPVSFGNLTNLVNFSLIYNQLSGPLPAELGALTNLEKLVLSQNQFSGPLPASWGGMTKLDLLALSNNQLNGSLPATLGNLSLLSDLHLDGNQLSGPIPTEITNLANLTVLRLNHNQLTGTIPPALGTLTNLWWLDLGYNQLTGSIPTTLGNLTNLTELFLYENQLSGPLPVEIGNLTKLINMGLGFNQLIGPIPSEYGGLLQLEKMVLSHNNLTGPIPVTLGNLTKLNRLWLEDNQLDGTVPAAIGNLTNLQELQVNTNNLQGPLPLSLSQLTLLEQFWFDNTTLCEPTESAFESWLLAVTDLRRTGVACLTELAVTKSATPEEVTPGTTVTVQVTVTADGAATMQMTETLPVGLTYVNGSATGGLQYDATTRRLTHTTAIDPTAPRHYQYQVTVDTTNEPSTILDLPTVVTGSDTNGLATTVANAGATLYIPNTALIKTLMLIYAVGDNDLGEGMIQLLNRAERATGGDPTVAVALLMDGPGAQDAYLYYLQPDTGQLNCPNYQNITCDGRYQFGVNLFTWRENTADVDSLATFIATAQRTYPTAQTIALSLVGHGSGWSPTLLAGQPHGIADQPHGIADQPSAGLLWDQSMIGDNTLSTGELRQALEQAQQATGQSVDLLYLDACSMAMAEVAYELSGTADYLLASQSISWAAFPYDQLILAIQEGMSGQEIGEAWLAIEADGLTAHSGVYPYTFSLVDLAQMPAVALAHQTLVSTLRAAWQSDTTRTVATAFADAVEATACVESNYDGKINRFDTYCDLGSFAQRIEGAFVDYPDIANAANAIGTALSSAIITTANHSGLPWSPPESEWWNFTAPPLNGLSLYMPLAPHVDDVRRRYYTANQLGYLTVTDWDTLLADAWGGSEPPTTTVDCDCPANVKLLPLQPSIRLQSPMVTVQEQEAFTVTVELLDLPQQRALGGAQLWLTYDANLVEGIDCTTVAPAGIQLAQCHLDAPGLIRLAFTAPDGFIQDFTAAQLHMRAIGPAGAVSTIRLIVDKLVDAQGAPLSVHTGDSLITIGAGAAQLAGDVNCSGGRDVQDAVLILRYSVSELAAGTQCPPAAGTIYAPACDVDGDGGCQINDALFIVQCAVGIDNGLCPASLQSASATTPRAINEQRRSAPPIQLIPSAIDDEGYIIFSLQTAREETKLGAVGITLRYDADQLELHECLQDPQTQFSYAACHPHDSSAVQTADNTGVVNVGLLAPEGVDGALQLATLRFRLRNPAFDNPVQFLAIENATVFDSRGTMLPNPQEEAQQIYLPVIVR